MANVEQRYRVYNRCKHDIGLTLMNGVQLNVRPGSFQLLTGEDILYLESICSRTKYFSSRMLVPVDNENKEMTLEDFGVAPDPDALVHMTDDEIAAMLKKPAKQVETWLENINEASELHAIYLVAKQLDLSATKLKLLNAKMPAKDWLGE